LFSKKKSKSIFFFIQKKNGGTPPVQFLVVFVAVFSKNKRVGTFSTYSIFVGVKISTAIFANVVVFFFLIVAVIAAKQSVLAEMVIEFVSFLSTFSAFDDLAVAATFVHLAHLAVVAVFVHLIRVHCCLVWRCHLFFSEKNISIFFGFSQNPIIIKKNGGTPPVQFIPTKSLHLANQSCSSSRSSQSCKRSWIQQLHHQQV
jgi:hypothetical protein